jgi:hypothetical protein
MRIREVLDKKIGETKYSKFLVTLPKKIVEESKLLREDIEVVSKSEKIILQKKKI